MRLSHCGLRQRVSLKLRFSGCSQELLADLSHAAQSQMAADGLVLQSHLCGKPFFGCGGGSLFINPFNTVRMAKLGKLGMAWYWFIVHRLVYPQDDNAALAPSEPLVA